MSGRRLQVPACDRCTQGVMDATNPHLLGTCSCACHAEQAACEHDWRRVRPVVRCVGEPDRPDAPAATYNAECGRCGARAWLHWPTPRPERTP